MSFALIAVFLVVVQPTKASAQSSLPPDGMAAYNAVSYSQGYNTGGAGGGGTCDQGAANSPGLWIICGYISFYKPGNNYQTSAVSGISGQPGSYSGLYIRGQYRVTSTTFSSPQYIYFLTSRTWNPSINWAQCSNSYKTYYDPVTGAARRAYAIGMTYRDVRVQIPVNQYLYTVFSNRYHYHRHTGYKVNGSSMLGVKAQVGHSGDRFSNDYTSADIGLNVLSRQAGKGYVRVNYEFWRYASTIKIPTRDVTQRYWTTNARYIEPGGCVYPQAPYSVYKWCPTVINGNMYGPYDNISTNPRYPVMTAPGVFDRKTQVKRWYVPLYSPVGNAYRTYGSNLSPSNSTAVNLVMGCQNMYYNVRVNNTQCYLGTTLLTGADNCSFTSGNYRKEATGDMIRCKYGVYPTGYNYRGNIFINCEPPVPNPTATYSGTAWWCSTAPNGANGWNNTDNFATDCKPAVPPVCTWSNGTGLPTIRDPYGVVQPSGTQVQADGKPWTITYPTLNCPGSQNTWQQWVIGKNSKPTRDGLAGNNSTQPVWGSYQSSGNGYLTYSGSSVGATGWTNNVITVKFNQATITNSGSSNLVVGTDSPNPVTVAPGQPIPFGIYSKYHYSLIDTSYSNVGGTVNFNNYKTVSGPMITFYAVSGRVTG